MPKRRSTQADLPVIPIEAILLELGAETVPTGTGWVKMHCFFHDDRRASAAVNHEVNAYYCHSCGRGGDSIKLLQNERGLSFRDALETAKGIAQIEGPQPGRKRRRSSELLI